MSADVNPDEIVPISLLERNQPPWWDTLVRHEPRLAELRHEIVALSPAACADAYWFGEGPDRLTPAGAPSFRARVLALVGPTSERRDPYLRTDAAVALALETLYALLPHSRRS